MKAILLATMAAICLTGCQKRTADVIAARPEAPVADSTLPKAVIYRTSGDYNRQVPITLNQVGRLVSYPAPSDITPDSAPLQLTGGWLLDRRGITPYSRFTKWTYAEYAALPAVPTRAELLEAIIPDAVITDYERLNITAAEAAADTAAVNALIRKGLPGCEPIELSPNPVH